MKSQNKLKCHFNISYWPEKKLNFWGITKCANTSIKKALLDNVAIEDSIYVPNNHLHDISFIRYIDKKTAKQNGCINFTVIRNPYNRCVSMYKDFVLKRPNHKITNHNVDRKNMSFDNFLQNIISHNIDDIHLKTQCSFIKNESKILVDHLFKIENIKDIEVFLNKSILKLNLSKGNINLNAKQKKIIYEVYKEDFDLLDYSK